MALPALPPLLMSPVLTAPPLAEAVATPPLPAEAVSVYCITDDPPCGPPRSPSTVASDSCESETGRHRPVARFPRFWRDRLSCAGRAGDAEKPCVSRVAHRFTSLGD